MEEITFDRFKQLVDMQKFVQSRNIIQTEIRPYSFHGWEYTWKENEKIIFPILFILNNGKTWAMKNN